MEKTDTRATAFGRALGALMEARGIPAEPEQVRALGERSGLDAEGLVALATSDPATDVGPLDGLGDELGLSAPEKGALAYAYCYGRDLPCAVPGCARPAGAANGLGDCEGHRREYDARAEAGAWEVARKILAPWVESAREIGSAPLTRVMEKALAEAEEAEARALDELGRAEAALGLPRAEGGGDA